MRESTVVTKSFVVSLLFIITIISTINILATDTRPILKALWSVSIVLVCLATAILITLQQRKTAAAIISVACALAIIALLVRGNAFAYCGDGVCNANDCTKGCAKDCTAAQCDDRVCTTAFEDCTNSADCRCAFGFACAPHRNVSNIVADDRGCVQISCGDGFCDLPEGTNSCCDDCGCPNEHRCERHACYFNPPRIELNTRMLTREISVTSLVGNHLFVNESGEARPLVGLLLQSTGYLRGAQLNFSLGGMVNETMFIGDVAPNTQRPVLWYVPYEPRLLTLEKDVSANLTVRAAYKDAANNDRTGAWIFPITIYARDKLDEYGSVALFVTQDYKPRSKTAQDIWREVQQQVKYDPSDTRPDDRIRFPAETLQRGMGTRSDIAVLLTSAYDAAGLLPSLVEGPVLKGGHGLYVRIKSGQRYVILDPTLISEAFDKAITQRPGYAVYDIDRLRYERNFTILSLNTSMIPGSMILSQSKIDVTCPCAGDCWTHAVATHTLTNNGAVASPVCAQSSLLSAADKKIVDVKEECYDLDPGQTVTLRHGWRNAIGCVDIRTELAVVDIR